MTMQERNTIYAFAKAAHDATEEVRQALLQADQTPSRNSLRLLAIVAQKAEQAAEAAYDAALSIDPDAALEQASLWSLHLLAMAAADAATNAAARARDFGKI